MSPERSTREEFDRAAAAPRPSMARELWDWMKHNRKWWLLPVLAALLVAGLLMVLASSGVGPFVYTLF
jgi:hypothetical protein